MLIFLLLLIFVLAAVGLAWYFIGQDHGEKEPIGSLWLAFGFGFVGAMLAVYLEGRWVSVRALSAPSPAHTILLAALMVGVIEEACKFVPLALFLYPKRYFNEHTDGIIYFALAGLGFGLPENILYTLQFGASTGLNRILLTPFFHAATTGIVGYFLIRGKLAQRNRLWSWLVLVGMMLLHGLYDFGLASGIAVFVILSIAITLGLNILLFFWYFRAVELDQQLGLSAVGHNSFCRSCGQPNPEHNLYCVHCGKRA